jgi:hypothetical protein
MTPEEIEREIQARVDFKMNEFRTAVGNMVGVMYARCYFNPSGHAVREWETYKAILGMVTKEIEMALPYNKIDKMKQKKARNKAVDEIERSLKLRGTRDGFHKLTIINSIIEKAQNYYYEINS